MHSHPHPNVSTHGQPPHPLVGTQPHSRPISIRVPVQTQTMPHPHRQNSAPIGWTPQHGSPLSTPVSAPAAPPPGYGLYAMNSNTNVTNPMSYRPASGTSASAGTSTGPRTPTFLPTPPMSALPLNLQNFASPGLVQAHAHAHPGPPRTASAASSVKSPALPPVSFSMPVPPLPVQSMPQEPEPQALPPEAPAPLEMQMQADGGREMQEVQPEVQDIGREMQDVPLEALNPGIGADIDDGGLQPRPKKEDAEPPEKMEVDEDDEEEDDDDEDGDDVGYIELGPDGLRTVRDCVAAVFDPEDEYGAVSSRHGEGRAE
ncbi:hypothetical protein B0H19DRAFT_368148 [Mycena capillaripes]|nr:hypothetical protein B0H19DRAFT_368148 [Mycena capillaripes]